MKQPKFVLSGCLLLLLSACDFSQEGLASAQTQPPPAGGARPASGGSGGRMPVGGRPGGAGGQNTPPPPETVDPPIPASPDAAVADGSVSPDGAPPASDAPDAPDGDAASMINTRPMDAPPAATQLVSCPAEQSALRLCLRFENNLDDESSLGRTVSGEQVSFEAGVPSGGRAARLSSQTSIRVADSAGLDLLTFTIEAWIKLDRLPTGSGRVAVVDKDGRYGVFVLPNGALSCSARGAAATTSGGAIPAGQWVAIACTATTGAVQSWVAGEERAEAASPSGTLGPLLPGMAIGSNMPSGDPLIGSLDNLRIWNRVLSEGEICGSALGCQ